MDEIRLQAYLMWEADQNDPEATEHSAVFYWLAAEQLVEAGDTA